MAMSDGQTAEVTLYGEIVSERPRDWWTDEPLEGDYIIYNEFVDDLRKVEGAKKITLRVNTLGGNVFESLRLYSHIKELSKKSEIVALIEGVVMSGGTHITCACTKVIANPASQFMIHNAQVGLGGNYSSAELIQAAAHAEAIDKSQLEIYKQKTGLSDEEITDMMAKTTFMTGAEAKEKGFVDELTDDTQLDIKASADLKTLYVAGRATHMQYPLAGVPDTIPTAIASDEDAANKETPESGEEPKGGQEMPKTLEELRAGNPELAAQIEANASKAAIEAERTRIRELDTIASLYGNEAVTEAKFGANHCTAAELAYREAQKMAASGKSFLAKMEEDAKASGAEEVPAVPPQEPGAITPEQAFAKGKADAIKIKGGQGK
jgi:ATP-dependent protease ClpP protease subunit